MISEIEALQYLKISEEAIFLTAPERNDIIMTSYLKIAHR